MLKVEEVKSIKVTCDMTPDQWDPNCFAVRDTTREHKAKLLNQRVEKFAPQLGPVEFYKNISRFAREQGFGSDDVIVNVTQEIYDVTLDFYSQETTAT